MNYQILMWLLALGCVGILSLAYLGWIQQDELERLNGRLATAQNLLSRAGSMRDFLMDTGQLAKWKEYNKHRFLERSDEVPWSNPLPDPELEAKLTEALRKVDDKLIEAEVIIVEAPPEPPMLPKPYSSA